jgi:hypothetical protein
MIFDARDALALGYRTLNSMCAQQPAMTLDYDSDNVDWPLTPTDDDQFTRNDILLSRQSGSAIQVTQPSGSMSTLAPPAGVGDYQYSQTASLASDAQLGDVAGWYLHLGTVDEQRFPQVGADLVNRALAVLFFDVQETDLGDYAAITDPPAWLTPDTIKAVIWGYTEVIGEYQFGRQFQTQPESPYEVLVAG